MIIAIDPSLTATGVAVLSPWEADPFWRVKTIRSAAPVAPPDPALAQIKRMERIVQELRLWITTSIVRPTFGVIESPAFSKNGGMSHERAGLWWMLYQSLAGYEIPVITVKPNLRSKYATGNGNAGKDEVLLAASRRYPGVPMTNNNEADAVVLAAMGARLMGHPIDTLPKTHLDALRTLQP
jgi:crossover junction endodeoxyribonuclease RuvC